MVYCCVQTNPSICASSAKCELPLPCLLALHTSDKQDANEILSPSLKKRARVTIHAEQDIYPGLTESLQRLKAARSIPEERAAQSDDGRTEIPDAQQDTSIDKSGSADLQAEPTINPDVGDPHETEDNSDPIGRAIQRLCDQIDTIQVFNEADRADPGTILPLSISFPQTFAFSSNDPLYIPSVRVSAPGSAGADYRH